MWENFFSHISLSRKRIACLLAVFLFSVPAFNQDKDTLNVDELLKLSLEQLLSVNVISATQTPQPINEAPAIITVITAGQINERGYRTVGEALQSVAGLDVLYDYLEDNVGVRGVNGGMRGWSRIFKVMINKQPVSFRPSSINFLEEELIPVEAIDRIEIIRGPGSALYGADAFLGVINIITRVSEKKITGSLFAETRQGKWINSAGGGFTFMGKQGGLNYLFSGEMINADRSGLLPVNVPGNKLYGLSSSKNDWSRPRSFYSKIEYKGIKSGVINLDCNFQQLDNYAEFQDWSVLTHLNRYNLENFYIRAGYSKEINPHINGNFSVAISDGYPGRNDQLHIDTSAGNWVSRDFECKGIDLAFDSKILLGKNSSLTIGADQTINRQNLLTYYAQSTSGSRIPQQGTIFGDTSFINTGLYLQTIFYPSDIIDKDLLKKFSITAGIRLDLHNIYHDAVNYRIDGVYIFNPKVFAKLLYGTSFKAPSSEQLYSNYILTGGVVGNPALKPETAKTLEFALGIKPFRNLNINTTIYYSGIQNKVELILPYGTISNVSYDNVAQINSAGAEVEIMHTLGNMFNYLNLSLQRSILSKENLIKRTVHLKNELYPEFTLKFGSNYPVSSLRLNINLEGRYTGSRIASQPNSFIYDPIDFRTHRYDLHPYFVMDLALSTLNIQFLKNAETKLQLKIYNLLNARYAFPGFRDFDIPGMERYMCIKLSQSF